jgi:anti-sigma factor RsiW
MSCIDLNDLSPRYLAGELDPQRAAEFSRHLESCAACARNHQLDSLLRTAVLNDPLETVRIDSGIRRHIARANSLRRTVIASAIAAALLVGIFIFTLARRADPVYADAAQDHQDEVINRQPRRWISDPALISALADRQAIPHFAIDAVSRAGFHLDRARLCTLNGRIFMHLVYSDDSHEFSVFLRRSAPGDKDPNATRQIGGDCVAGIEMPEVAALVVTPQMSDAARITAAARSVL